jgi:hypothetical protein
MKKQCTGRVKKEIKFINYLMHNNSDKHKVYHFSSLLIPPAKKVFSSHPSHASTMSLSLANLCPHKACLGVQTCDNLMELGPD